ncbi:MAG: LysE family translocator [Aestuariivirgaceae bacterium]
MTLETYIAYVAACIILSIVPGPNVTIIVANSLRGGTRAGMASVVGTQLGVLLALIVLAAGLQVIIHSAGVVFEIIRLIGAGYLVWLGYKMLTSGGKLQMAEAAGLDQKTSAYFWQGCLVFLSNPKALVFFGAFIPQFLDPSRDTFVQMLLLGATFMAVTSILDSGYALAAGRARQWLSRSRVQLVERFSGCCMIAGGLWLALARR